MKPVLGALATAIAIGVVVFVLEAFIFEVSAPALGAVVVGLIAGVAYLIQSNSRTRL